MISSLKKSFLLIIFVYSCAMLFLSCKKENEGIENIYQEMNSSPYGEEISLSLYDENWSIEAVTNVDGQLNIFGKIFRANGSLIAENQMLRLEEAGKLIAVFSNNKGFEIIKNKSGNLRVTTFENLSDKPFYFIIKLKKGEERREIAIRQEMSEGYDIESITYHQSPDDYDSLYNKRGTQINTNMLSPSEIKFDPFKNGIDMFVTSYFVPEINDQYAWPNKDSVQVVVPDDIIGGTLILNGTKKRVYGVLSKNDIELGNKEIKVSVPEGQSSFYTQTEWRKRQLSYILVLKHKKHPIKKTLTGRWIELSPTGNYQIFRD